ncbi:MAG: peptidylprolyl isomerase [Gammaproteobacteria bacterium]|nr:peptidylprolyl isomerase [Gammaproteobacteria bacterium]
MRVRISTNLGDIVVELDRVRAPATTDNFLGHVREGFYDGTIFHRVIDNFMIQAGGFESGMQRKAQGESIDNEADNGLSNVPGSVAMARTSDPHSASTQFFINAADNAFLDFTSRSPEGWGYCVFGAVVDGMEVVDAIVKVPTTVRAGHKDVPVDEVVIESAREINSEHDES